ncbi:hypothetical protein [Rhodobacter sp. NSM]|uniref:hypothetical protein n=1 Tax=Rhodobacter sp. NSM TaxID=3457501 RepID=UPI003FD23FF1
MIPLARLSLSLAAALLAAAPLPPDQAHAQTVVSRPMPQGADQTVILPWTRPVLPGEGHGRPAAWGRIYPPPQEVRPAERQRDLRRDDKGGWHGGDHDQWENRQWIGPHAGDHHWDQRRAREDWRRWSDSSRWRDQRRAPPWAGPPRPALDDLPGECLIISRAGSTVYDGGCLARYGISY